MTIHNAITGKRVVFNNKLSNKNGAAVIRNNMDDLIGGMINDVRDTAQISKVETIQRSIRRDLISNNRRDLTDMYYNFSIVESIIDTPVDDGFKSRYEIKSANQLDEEDISDMMKYAQDIDLDSNIKQAIKWERLFGGAGLIVNESVDVDHSKPFNEELITKDTKLRFNHADLWEITTTRAELRADLLRPNLFEPNKGQYFYYGKNLHSSRVKILTGIEPPSLIKLRLRGWGLSQIEKLIRPLNEFLKNSELVFELLDEKKIDVFKIDNLNSSMLSDIGTQSVLQRIRLVAQTKNYNNAIVIDREDDFSQKELQFTGLAEVSERIDSIISNATKMPKIKLFGNQSTGLASDTEGLENYNCMVERDIRQKHKKIIIYCYELIAKKLFGFIPDDLEITFPPLREMTQKEEEEIKTSKFSRLMEAYDRDLIDDKDLQEKMKKYKLL